MNGIPVESKMKAQLHSYRDRDQKNGGRLAALTGPLPHAPRIGPRTALLWSPKDPKDMHFEHLGEKMMMQPKSSMQL